MKFDYELLDSGHWLKLERFGSQIIERPESQADWQPKNPVDAWPAQAACLSQGGGKYTWEKQPSFQDPWQLHYGDLCVELRCSQSKNIGIFPEQEDNWRFIVDAIKPAKQQIAVLNLFAYTGLATLVAANAGASVCHVDSSKYTVKWASKNAELSGLVQKPIRWIVDDAMKFLEREARRRNAYDAIILDPPPFGHAQGKRFMFEEHIVGLLQACKRVLSKNPAFFLLNSYAMGLKPEDLRELVLGRVGNFPWEFGELRLREANREKWISCSTYARFRG